jgi:hypothetical protein
MEELGLPYIEPGFGQHAAPMDRERARADAVEYVTHGYRILPGWGLHRAKSAMYAHISYTGTEGKAA